MIENLCKANTSLISALFAAFILGSPSSLPSEAVAQTYPAKPIRIVVPGLPGGGPDIIARLIGAKLTEALGQPTVIDNRAGAGGRIGLEFAAKSAPDGYTVVLSSSGVNILTAMYDSLKFDIVKDFAPVSLLGTTPLVLLVNPAVPATSITELVALAKSRPGKLKYGSGGSGSGVHLAAEIFKFAAGINILHVPYKGVAAALTSTLTGEVDMSFQNIPGGIAMIKSGKLRALGVTSVNRTQLIPDLPSISEFVPGSEFIGWYGVIAPAKTPPVILSKLNTEVIGALNDSTVREKMKGLGVDILGTSQNEFALFISEQLEKMRKAVNVSGARPED